MSSAVDLTADSISDCPPGHKLVYLTLCDIGPATIAELRAETGLAKSTVYVALDNLRDRDLVERERDTADPNRHRYAVASVR